MQPPTVFTVYLSPNASLGLRLEEHAWPRGGSPRVWVSSVSANAQPALVSRVLPGDWLIDVGFKFPEHSVWNWETVCGYSLEDCHACLQDAMKSGRVLAIRFVRLLVPQVASSPPAAAAPSLAELANGPTTRSGLADKPATSLLYASESASRVGADFQVDALPSPAAAGSSLPPHPPHDVTLFSPRDLPPHVLDQALAKAGAVGRAAERADAFLQAWYSSGGAAAEAAPADKGAAAAQCGAELDDAESLAFEAAMFAVGARDFATVRLEMRTARPVGDLVRHYYGKWKKPLRDAAAASPAHRSYEEWKAEKRRRFSQPVVRCMQCSQTDAYGDALHCAACRGLYHLECAQPPLCRISPFARPAWQCAACASGLLRNVQQQRQLVQQQQRQGGGGGEDARQRRGAAVAAQSAWAQLAQDGEDAAPSASLAVTAAAAAAGGRPPGRPGRPGASKRQRIVQGPTYDAAGRRIQFIKGVRIDPEALFQAVALKGGYGHVVQRKLWQQVRKLLGLPHTTSSSNQLRHVYASYKAQGGEPLGSGGQEGGGDPGAGGGGGGQGDGLEGDEDEDEEEEEE